MDASETQNTNSSYKMSDVFFSEEKFEMMLELCEIKLLLQKVSITHLGWGQNIFWVWLIFGLILTICCCSTKIVFETSQTLLIILPLNDSLTTTLKQISLTFVILCVCKKKQSVIYRIFK